MLRRLDSLFLLGGGKRFKSCMARIVPNNSAFWKRNTFLGSFLILPIKRGGVGNEAGPEPSDIDEARQGTVSGESESIEPATSGAGSEDF
jgi:hypothetical protein